MLSAVLPVKIAMWGHDDLERAKILLRSLRRFLPPGELSVLYLAHHEADDPELVRRALEPFSDLPIEAVSEVELVPELAGTSRRHWSKWFRKGRTKNWFRQQIVKLGVARRIQTEHYLTLDADVICTKPVGEADLLVDGRAILDQEPRSRDPRWWRKSSMLLGLPFHAEGYGCAVTPEVLCTDVVRQLLDRLEERSGGKGWVELLVSTKGWTEYTLYDLFANSSGLMKKRHHLDPDPERPTRKIHGPSLLFPFEDPTGEAARRALEQWAEEAFSETAPGFFSVVQSRTGLSPGQVWSVIGDRIEGPGA